MPPFCRVRLLAGDEHAHSFCRCVTGSGNYEVKVAALACTIRAGVGYVLLGDFPNVERSECASHKY